MTQASGFAFEARADGSVVIAHHGRAVTVLRGARATEFLDSVRADPQGTMARWTGNYRRGNERAAKQHPRNRT